MQQKAAAAQPDELICDQLRCMMGFLLGETLFPPLLGRGLHVLLRFPNSDLLQEEEKNFKFFPHVNLRNLLVFQLTLNWTELFSVLFPGCFW